MLCATLFCLAYGITVWPSLTQGAWSDPGVALLWFKVAVEMAFSFPAATMLLLTLAYFCRRRGEAARPTDPAPRLADEELPPLAVLYLCCGDLDHDSVRSLMRLRYRGDLHLVIHDDLPRGDPKVDAIVRQLAGGKGPSIEVLRRPVKEGGKPGAINWVLERLDPRYEYFFLCDNDSVAVEASDLEQLVAKMADPSVAVVQCRNVAAEDAEYCGVNRVMSRAIDVFNLFMVTGRRHGWCPFVGHNALLRRSAVQAVGGLTPGCFADDIDLTVRLQLEGQRVEYAEEVPFGEKHPPSYRAFRTRTYKWSYGSMQILKRHAWNVIRSRRLAFAEKWGFFQFIGFYTLQSILLLYVGLLLLVAPWFWSAANFDLGTSLIAGTVIPVLIFLPVVAHEIAQRRIRGLPGFIGACWLGYGATDFPTARGVRDGFLGLKRRWVPTNSIGTTEVEPRLLWEASFGLGLLTVPLFTLPVLIYSPLTILVAIKFILLPTMDLLYRDGEVAPQPARRPILRWVAMLLITFLLSATGLPGSATTRGSESRERPARTSVTTRGSAILVDGRPYVVRGVHYSPWRPKTGPGRSPYPSASDIDADLGLVAAANANTILVYDPPRFVLDLAQRRGLRVLYAFWIDWRSLDQETLAGKASGIAATVAGLREHPALLGWMLGNEIPSSMVQERGAEQVENLLRRLYHAVKRADGAHLVTHANWPNTRTLDLSFLDVVAFNVYALWPPELVARGYGNFIRDVLKPLAGNKPLLIAEYGTNSLEAGEDGQARLTVACWQQLRAAGAVGGFAFEFADEWWKNYCNPKIEGAWWDRELDLDDHLVHDRDPEEHYGLMTIDRQPKPAYAAIAEAYGAAAAGPDSPDRRAFLLVGTLVGLGLLCFLGACRWQRRRSSLPTPTEESAPAQAQ